MKRMLFGAIGITGLLSGCVDTGVDGNSASGAEKAGTKGSPALSMAAATVQSIAPTASPHRYSWRTEMGSTSSGENIAMEMEHYCAANEVVTGFGAYAWNGNVDGITLQCSDTRTGYLSTGRATVGGSGLVEAGVSASPNYVVVAVGGVINGGRFRRAVIKECYWIPYAGYPDLNSCRYKSSDGNPAMEEEASVMGEGRAVSGIGLTAGSEILSRVKVRIGHLVGYPIYWTNISGKAAVGSEPGYDFSAEYKPPAWGRNISVQTGGGTGNSDLYIRNGSYPTFTNYFRASTSSNTSDLCEGLEYQISPNPTWYIWMPATSTYSGVTLQVRIWE